MTAVFGIDFESGADDFDRFLLAAFRGGSNQPFWLFRYENSPLSGADMVVDSECPRSVALGLIWDEWQFDIRELAWITEWEEFPDRERASQVRILPTIPRQEVPLSGRETQVALALSRGKAVSDIARELRIAPSTVSGHLQRIYLKLGVHSRAELIERLRRQPGIARSA
jgi:DNA-binding CsgD family transcriptional regulator